MDVSTIAGDHWPAMEIDTLKDLLAEAEAMAFEAKLSEEEATMQAQHLEGKYKVLKETFDDKVAHANSNITEKMMIYLSLINEYEILLGTYASNSMVKLKTTQIDNLRKRGGLPT